MRCNRARPRRVGPLPSSGASVARPAVAISRTRHRRHNHVASLRARLNATHRTNRDAHATLEPRTDQDRSSLHERGLPSESMSQCRDPARRPSSRGVPRRVSADQTDARETPVATVHTDATRGTRKLGGRPLGAAAGNRGDDPGSRALSDEQQGQHPMMASGKNAKKSRTPAPVVTRRQGLPWLTIGAVVGRSSRWSPASSGWCTARPRRRTPRRRARPVDAVGRQPGPVDGHPGHLCRRQHPGDRGRPRPATSTTRPPSTSPLTSGWPTTGTRRSAARTTAPGRTATGSSTPRRCAARTWCTPWSTAPCGSPTTRTPSRTPT